MLPGQTYTLDRIVRTLKGQWYLVLVPLVLGTFLGAMVYHWMPLQYRSDTLIMVVPQRIPDGYVKATVSSDVQDRLRSVSELILSRSRLERIIQDFDLYQELRASGPMEDVIKRMTSDIDVELQKDKASFRVSYGNPDPGTAQRVTERLAALFIEENAKDREQLAENTNAFLESQVESAKSRLLEQEQKLERYRREHAGQLPSQLPGNMQAMQNSQMQLQALNESMNRARERRLLIERQIADTQALPLEVTPAQAGPEASAGLPASQQLVAARAALESMKQRYTLDHPDVQALEERIQELEVRAADEAKAPTAERPRSPVEFARQKRLSDLRAELEVIDLQLKSSQTEEARLRGVIQDYSAKIDVVPTRESELVELTRDYATLQASYTGLLQKLEDSKISKNLERRQIGEQFRILDPASLPERPSNQQNRLAGLVGGPFLGVALGFLLIGWREYRDDSFKSEDDVVRVLSLPVLALVPMVGIEHGRGTALRRPQRASRKS